MRLSDQGCRELIDEDHLAWTLVAGDLVLAMRDDVLAAQLHVRCELDHGRDQLAVFLIRRRGHSDHLDAGELLDHRFHLVRIDLLAAGVDALGTATDEREGFAVVVQLRQIAAHEPGLAVELADQLRGLFRVLVIALRRDIGASRQFPHLARLHWHPGLRVDDEVAIGHREGDFVEHLVASRIDLERDTGDLGAAEDIDERAARQMRLEQTFLDLRGGRHAHRADRRQVLDRRCATLVEHMQQWLQGRIADRGQEVDAVIPDHGVGLLGVIGLALKDVDGAAHLGQRMTDAPAHRVHHRADDERADAPLNPARQQAVVAQRRVFQHPLQALRGGRGLE